MSFQIWIKTDKPLPKLATEIRDILSLPPFRQEVLTGEPYYQFEMLGMLIFLHLAEEEDRDPEVMGYPYRFDMQTSFVDHELDTDSMEYGLQPYYAQLLTFHLGIETAYQDKKKADKGKGWQIRYNYCCKNPHWDSTVLYGEPGWEPAIKITISGPWRKASLMF